MEKRPTKTLRSKLLKGSFRRVFQWQGRRSTDPWVYAETSIRARAEGNNQRRKMVGDEITEVGRGPIM